MEGARQRLSNTLTQLESPRITDRDKASERLIDELHNEFTIQYLREVDESMWTTILNTVQACLLKEHEKNIQDLKKKPNCKFSVRLSVDLLSIVLSLATKEGPGVINITKSLKFMLEILNTELGRKIYERTFLKIIINSFLTNSKIRGFLSTSYWQKIFTFVKSVYETNAKLDVNYSKCAFLLLKWGTRHNVGICFQNEFQFFTQLCQKISSDSSRADKEIILDIAFEFCQQMAYDNRLGCARFGEEVLPTFLEMYNVRKEENSIKLQTVNFFALQFALHNPKGCTQLQSASYANNWSSWRNCMVQMFHYLNLEVENNFSNGEEVIQSSILFVNDNTREISETFVSLYVNILRQLWDTSCSQSSSMNSDSTTPPSKRKRVDLNFDYLMDLVNTKSWAWIAITCTFIKTYPSLISSDNLIEIIRKLDEFFNDSNSSFNFRNHIFKGLVILDDIQQGRNDLKVNEHSAKILWSNVAKFALRSINNIFKNDENLHELVRRLIAKRVINWDSLYENYRTSDVNITEHNLKTLDYAFNYFALIENKSVKIELLTWILNQERLKIYPVKIENDLAKFLVYLTLKRWPSENLFESNTRSMQRTKNFDGLEDLLEITSLEKLILPTVIDNKILPTGDVKLDVRVEVDVLVTLTDSLLEFISSAGSNVKNDSHAIERDFRKCALTLKVISHLLTLDLLDENCMKKLFELFEVCSKILDESYSSFTFINKISSCKKYMERLMNLNGLFDNLLDCHLNPLLGEKLKSCVSVELLKSMFGILKFGQEGKSNSAGLVMDVKKSVITSLVNFCCVSLHADILPMQEKALECLFSTSYNYMDDMDYEMLMTFLEALANCEFCQWTEYTLISVYTFLQGIAGSRYRCILSVESILKLFPKLYPIVVASKHPQVKAQFVDFLYQFYEKRTEYGPSVSILILDSMIMFYEIDTDYDKLLWCNVEVCMKFSDFLTDEHQQVRLTAIEKIVTFFHLSSRNYDSKQYKRQERIFSRICQASVDIFQLDKTPSECRIIEESVTKSASVLQSFASIISTSRVWMEDALYAMMNIAKSRNIVENLKRILDAISSHLQYGSRNELLKHFLDKLLPRWQKSGIEDFHCYFQNCDSKLDLYVMNWPSLAPFLAEFDRPSLDEMAQRMGKTLPEILVECSPVLLAHSMAKSVIDNIPLKDCDMFKFLNENVIKITEIDQILTSKIDQILLNLLKLFFDNEELNNHFGEVIFLRESGPRLNMDHLKTALTNLQNLLGVDDLLLTLMKKRPHKVTEVLLGLKILTHHSLYIEEKIISFHSYAIISSLILEKLGSVEILHESFLRDLIYTLSHFINLHKISPKLSLCAVKYLKLILSQILCKYPQVVGDLLLVIVTILKKLTSNKAVSNDDITIGEISGEILESLENGGIESHRIYKYCFPDSRLNNVTGNNFEVEISNFLTFTQYLENKEDCEDGLKYLKTLLKTHKKELKSLLERLRTANKTFTEDGATITFRQLICTLVKLSLGSNETVSSGAICCLGEIGPVDLASLLLVPEESTVDPKWTPWEIINANVAAMLCQYIVNPDINLAKMASDTLVRVFNTKEGIKIIDSGEDFGSGQLNKNLLVPFLPSLLNQPALAVKVDLDLFDSVITCDDLWIPKSSNHERWIVSLVTSILSCFGNQTYFHYLTEICKFKVEFCEKLLPLLIDAILRTTNRKSAISQVISKKIGIFFEEHWKISNDKTTNNFNGNVASLLKSVKCMLDVVQFVRLQHHSKSKKANEENPLQLNYLYVAKAAQSCQKYFTALLYVEIWCDKQVEENPSYQSDSSSNLSLLDKIYQNLDEVSAKSLHDILLRSYESIGETDAFSGCGTNFLHDRTFRLQYYKHLNRWDEVIRYHENQLSIDNNHPRELFPLIDGLKHSNLHSIATLICSKNSPEPDYESLWRLGQWDRTKLNNLDDYSPDGDSSRSNNFEKYRFFALKALNNDEECAYGRALAQMRSSVLEQLRHVNLQSTKSFNNCMGNIRAVSEIQEFYSMLAENKNSDVKSGILTVLDKWETQDDITCKDIEFVEAIKSQRIVMFGSLLEFRENFEEVKNVLVNMMLDFCEYLRIEGNSQLAYRSISKLVQLSENLADDDLKTKIAIEDAQLCWAKGDSLTAKCILRQVNAKENINPSLRALVLKMAGKWLAEDASENRQVIIRDYFLKSLSCDPAANGNAAESKSLADSYIQLAKFADRNYQQVQAHIKSDLFQKKIRNMEKSKLQATQKVAKVSSNKEQLLKDVQRALTIRERQRNCDQIELKKVEKEKTELLAIALKYYIKSLIVSDLDNINIFRTFALFLENRDHNNSQIEEMLKTEYTKIPTYKFIAVLPQVIPHILANASSNDLFSRTTTKIVEKCAMDHPHHALPLLTALANANKDLLHLGVKKPDKDDRAHSADKLMEKLKRCPSLTATIKEMEVLSDALIELAYDKTSGKEGAEITIPPRSKIHKVKDFNNILLPTFSLPVSKARDYSRIIGIHSFEASYLNVGGINAPKRIICCGTDGLKRTQLVKGQDDLRQDAVMQQVFTVINDLLAANEQTRYLRIRTYKIVPLSKRSGILEWVKNTLPIGEYLAGKDRAKDGEVGAHELYNPGDPSPRKCRGDMRKCQDKDVAQKLKVFNQICRQLKPVFHKFFESNFPRPTIWYERRRAYIHSVATTSMCGYILGIGDRHVNNILIDKNTAEVVHIDFGIAFEQGLVLPTPETVPFRLTRDIVDGMGIAGVKGLFTRSCEKTMEVLRTHSQPIITILEVLLYDPLYDWTVSTAEANKRQQNVTYDGDESLHLSDEHTFVRDINVTAERALLRLRAKLQGTESGTPSTVQHQVGTLIQQAVDPMNLCCVFNGWQPYL